MASKLNILLVNQTIGELFNEIIIRTFKKYNLTIFSGKTFIKSNNKYRQYKSISYNNKSILMRLITWFIFTLDLTKFTCLKGRKYKKILIVSNPPLSFFVGILLKKNSFSLLIYDLYPEIIKNRYKKLTHIYLFKFLIKIWRYLNFLSFQRARYIFCLSNEMADSIKNYFEDDPSSIKKIKIISPWYSSKLKSYEINKINSFRENYKDNQRLLISYSGNIGISHPIELIIEGIKDFKKIAKFIIISKGNRFEELKYKAKKLGITKNDLDFLSPLSERNYFKSLEAIDLSIVALDDFASKESLPSKTFNSLFFGKPIIGLSYKDSSLDRLINKYECGINIEPEYKNINHLKRKLYELNKNYLYLETLSKNAKNASKDFNPDNSDELISLWLDN